MKKRKGKAEVKIQPDDVFKKNAAQRDAFEKEFMPEEYKAQKAKKRKKWLIGFLAILIVLLLAVLAVVKFVLPLFGGGKEKESDVDFSSFVTTEEMQVEQTADSYKVTAKVTVPDMSKYIEEFSASKPVKEQNWEKAEKKVEEAFYKFMTKQKDLTTVTYDMEVDLKPYLEEYMLSLEYWSTHEEAEEYVFTEEQIQEILRKEAFLRSMETLIYE